MVKQGRSTYSGGAAAAVDFEQVPGVAFEVHAEVGAGCLVVAAGHLVEHVPLGTEEGDAAVGGQQPGEGLGSGVIDQPPRDRGHDEVGGLGGSGDRLRLPLLLKIGRSLSGGGLSVGGGLVGDAPQGDGLGDRREGGGGLLAFELRDWPGEGGEHAALAGAGVHANGHEQAQRLPPAGAGLDLDRAGGDGGEHGQGEHAGQIWWGLGGGGDRRDIVPEPAGQHLDRKRGRTTGGPERHRQCPAAPINPVGSCVGQLASEMGEHGRVGVRVGKTDAQVDYPSAPRRLGDQLGVVGGIRYGGHGRNQGMQERSTAHIG
jgi:hypothetical protein